MLILGIALVAEKWTGVWGAFSCYTLIARKIVGFLSDKKTKVLTKFVKCFILLSFFYDGKDNVKMYLKDKSQRITLRLNEQQFAFVRSSADSLGVSPSDFLRMVVNFSMTAARKADEAMDSVAEKMMEGQGRENDKTDKHDIV